MAYYSFPLERIKYDIPKSFCYLVIAKYPDNHFKPSEGRKKLSSKELEEKQKTLNKQKETINQLKSGYINIFNNEIELSSILDSSFIRCYMNLEECWVYKIEPITARIKNQDFGYKQNYFVSEFNVSKCFKYKEEIIKEINNDDLLPRFSREVFNAYSYANEGFDIQLREYFSYIKKTYPTTIISLSDILLIDTHNGHINTHIFEHGGVNRISVENLKYLINNNIIEFFKEYEYYKHNLIMALMCCQLFEVAEKSITFLHENELQELKENKHFNTQLRKFQHNETVKNIINSIGGITKTDIYVDIKDSHQNIVETFEFKNMNEVKTHLIKNFQVSFETLLEKDIEEISFYDNNDNKFTVELS